MVKPLKGIISPPITPISISLMKFEWPQDRQSLWRKKAKVLLEKNSCNLTNACLFSWWRSPRLSKHFKWPFSKSFSNSSNAHHHIESTNTTNGTTVGLNGLLRTRLHEGEWGQTGHAKFFNHIKNDSILYFEIPRVFRLLIPFNQFHDYSWLDMLRNIFARIKRDKGHRKSYWN